MSEIMVREREEEVRRDGQRVHRKGEQEVKRSAEELGLGRVKGKESSICSFTPGGVYFVSLFFRCWVVR